MGPRLSLPFCSAPAGGWFQGLGVGFWEVGSGDPRSPTAGILNLSFHSLRRGSEDASGAASHQALFIAAETRVVRERHARVDTPKGWTAGWLESLFSPRIRCISRPPCCPSSRCSFLAPSHCARQGLRPSSGAPSPYRPLRTGPRCSFPRSLPPRTSRESMSRAQADGFLKARKMVVMASQTSAVRAGRCCERTSTSRALAATALAGRFTMRRFPLRNVAVLVRKQELNLLEAGTASSRHRKKCTHRPGRWHCIPQMCIYAKP